jgi:hypothetical protein
LGGAEHEWFDLRNAFTAEIGQLRSLGAGTVNNKELAFEIGLRRWLQLEPASAPEIMKRAQETKWPPQFPGQVELRSAGPSTELFLIWAKADLPAMIAWAESLADWNDELALRSKGFLMSRIDQQLRQRWLSEAKAANEEGTAVSNLMRGWAAWDPKPALAAAVASGNPGLIWEVADQVADGPWVWPPNSVRFGRVAIRDFESIPEKIRPEATGDWYALLERWGETDVGETARYGLEYLLKTDYAPRERLMRFFSGHDEYPDEGSMIDRTFCALRMWAVVEPKKMKAWIATLEDRDLAKSLSWLLNHPWGGKARTRSTRNDLGSRR